MQDAWVKPFKLKPMSKKPLNLTRRGLGAGGELRPKFRGPRQRSFSGYSMDKHGHLDRGMLNLHGESPDL